MIRHILAVLAFVVAAASMRAATDTTQLSVVVLSKEADTPLRGLEVVVVDDSTSASQTALTDTIGKATFNVVRGTRVAVYVMRIGILNGAEKVFTVPKEGLMSPIAISLSKEQIDEAKANLDKQLAGKRELEQLKERINGSMAFRTVRGFLDTVLVEKSLANETVEFTSISSGKRISVASNADGYMFLKGASIDLKDGDKFSMTSLHVDSEKIPFQDGTNIMEFEFQSIKTDNNWSGQYSYLAIPIPTKRLPVGELTPSVSTIAITDTLKADLALIADFIKRKQYVVEIQAYTDNTGTEKDAAKRAATNKKLSQQRAESIVTYLTKQLGVESKYLKAIGYGEEFPIADNTTDQGRKINRRVVVKITR
ncbi:MAG: OmpA family protein [Ignavibacteria bacterium]|nr:OmpA family protein [Ignavibacteria bacterium]